MRSIEAHKMFAARTTGDTVRVELVADEQEPTRMFIDLTDADILALGPGRPSPTMTDMPILDDEAMTVLAEVLTYHYRKNSSDCGCGWAKLGASHPAHVAEVFKDSLMARQPS